MAKPSKSAPRSIRNSPDDAPDSEAPSGFQADHET